MLRQSFEQADVTHFTLDNIVIEAEFYYFIAHSTNKPGHTGRPANGLKMSRYLTPARHATQMRRFSTITRKPQKLTAKETLIYLLLFSRLARAMAR